jgi:hypothetical protein
MKQSTHSKIELLSEVKSEAVILEGRRGEIEKSNLISDGEASTRVIDLLPGQASFPQQQPRLDPFLFSTPKCEPSDDTQSARKCVEIIAAGIAHAQQSHLAFQI